MLGREIIDCGIEETVGAVPALGLLDATTRFDLYEKKTEQVEKTVTGGGPILEPIRGQKVRGYEIHMGQTSPAEKPAFEDDGAVSGSGMVIGTYLHGLFDNQNFRAAFLHFLRRQRAGNEINETSERQEDECQSRASEENPLASDGFAQLAEATAAHLDIKRIYQMLDLD